MVDRELNQTGSFVAGHWREMVSYVSGQSEIFNRSHMPLQLTLALYVVAVIYAVYYVNDFCLNRLANLSGQLSGQSEIFNRSHMPLQLTLVLHVVAVIYAVYYVNDFYSNRLC